MQRVVAIFVEDCHVLWRCSVRAGYFVLQVFVDMACKKSIVRVCGGVNEDVAIE